MASAQPAGKSFRATCPQDGIPTQTSNLLAAGSQAAALRSSCCDHAPTRPCLRRRGLRDPARGASDIGENLEMISDADDVKERRRIYHAAYYKANKKKHRAHCAAYHAKNREKIIANKRAYRVANKMYLKLRQNGISHEEALTVCGKEKKP